MTLRRLSTSVVLLLIFSIAACSQPSPPPVAKPFDAKAALVASTSGIDTGAYRFYVGRPDLNQPDLEMYGILHAPSGTADLTSTSTKQSVEVKHRALFLGDERYLKMSLTGGQWTEYDMQLDVMEESTDPKVRKEAKFVRELRELTSGTYWMPPTSVPSTLAGEVDLRDPDSVGLKRLLDRVRTAEGSSLIITGTIDATGLAKDPTIIGRMARMSPPSGQVTALPFRATLDAKDRIATLDLTMPGKAGVWSVKLEDYGGVQALKRPDAGEIKKPSARVLRLLSGGGIPT